MKKLLLALLLFTQCAYAQRSLPDASKRFQDSLSSFLKSRNAANAQKVVAEYDSSENTDKYRRTFDSTLQTNKVTIAQLRSLAAAQAPAPTKAPAAPTPAVVTPAPKVTPVAPTITTPYEALPKTVPAPAPTPAAAPAQAPTSAGTPPPPPPAPAPYVATAPKKTVLTIEDERNLFSRTGSAVSTANKVLSKQNPTLKEIDDAANALKIVKGQLTLVEAQDKQTKDKFLKQIENQLLNLEQQQKTQASKAAPAQAETATHGPIQYEEEGPEVIGTPLTDRLKVLGGNIREAAEKAAPQLVEKADAAAAVVQKKFEEASKAAAEAQASTVKFLDETKKNLSAASQQTAIKYAEEIKKAGDVVQQKTSEVFAEAKKIGGNVQQKAQEAYNAGIKAGKDLLQKADFAKVSGLSNLNSEIRAAEANLRQNEAKARALQAEAIKAYEEYVNEKYALEKAVIDAAKEKYAEAESKRTGTTTTALEGGVTMIIEDPSHHGRFNANDEAELTAVFAEMKGAEEIGTSFAEEERQRQEGYKKSLEQARAAAQAEAEEEHRKAAESSSSSEHEETAPAHAPDIAGHAYEAYDLY